MFNRKEYYKTHPEARKKRLEYMLEYNKNNPNKEYQKQWREKNKKRDKVIRANKYKNDMKYKLILILRARIGKALKYNLKSKNTKKLLGCTIEELKKYLEGQFKEGMSWENHSQFGWHIDHKIPCEQFDLSKKDEQCKCFHYTNLQPLWWQDNLSKNNKLIKNEA